MCYFLTNALILVLLRVFIVDVSDADSKARLNLALTFFQAYCHYQEAALHLRHVLELKPNYGPALQALQDMDSIPDTSVHVYTLVIIVILVLAVIVWIVTSWEGLIGGDSGSSSSGESSFSGGKLNRLKFRNNGTR